MERAGISLKRMADMTGYDKTTLWHALNDERYKERLSRKFWGKIGATIRWKVKPLVIQMNDKGFVVFRCPHCKTFFKVKVKARTKVIVEPVLWSATNEGEGMSKDMERQQAIRMARLKMARSKNVRKTREKESKEVD